MVNLPAFFTSVVARLAKLSSSCEHCVFFNPLEVAKASAMAPLVRALAETAFFFMTFMATIGRGWKSSCTQVYF